MADNYKNINNANQEQVTGRCAFGKVVAAVPLIALVLMIGGAHGQSAERGGAFARTNCAKCHAIDKSGESPLRDAPPFRSLHKRYPVDFASGSPSRGHHNRACGNAGIRSHSPPNRRFARVSQNNGVTGLTLDGVVVDNDGKARDGR